MVKKILKILTNNLGFKLLAVLFAFAMWLVVYNINDPSSSKTFTATVNIQNAQAVSDMGKCYEVMDGSGTVSFRVTAKRSILEKLNYSDFTASADMSLMTLNEDGTEGSVPISIAATNYTASVKLNGLTKYLKVSLEDLQEKQFVITADTKGKVASGFTLGDVSVSNPNVIKVSGPASVVGQISSVVATIDVSGMSVDISDNVVPVFYNADDEAIDTTKLTLSNNTVTVSAKILSTKEVPINFNTTGTPADTYSVVGISCSPETVQIKGSSSVLNPITSIDIPEEVIDVSGANKDITTTVDISEYLPDGVTLTKNTQASVSVTVRIEPYVTQSYSIPVSNITTNGLDSEYTLSYSQSTVTAGISGMSGDLAQLAAASIKGIIDVTTLGEGTHTVAVTLELDDSKYIAQNVTTDITITKKQTDSDNGTQSGSENGTGQTQGTTDSSTSESGSESQTGTDSSTDSSTSSGSSTGNSTNSENSGNTSGTASGTTTDSSTGSGTASDKTENTD